MLRDKEIMASQGLLIAMEIKARITVAITAYLRELSQASKSFIGNLPPCSQRLIPGELEMDPPHVQGYIPYRLCP